MDDQQWQGAVLEAMVALHPDSLGGYQRLARLAWDGGDTAAARRHLNAALALDPEGRIAGLRQLQSDVLRAEGQISEAEAVLKRLAGRMPPL